MQRGRPKKTVTLPVQLPSTDTLVPRGRPTKYHEGLCEELKDYFYNGWSVAMVCRKWGIDDSTFYLWKNKHIEFNEAFKVADTAARGYFDGVMIAQACSNEKAPNGMQLALHVNNRFKEHYSRNPTDNGGGNQTNNFLVLGHEAITEQIRNLIAGDKELIELYESRESEGTFSVITSEEADREGEQVFIDVPDDGSIS